MITDIFLSQCNMDSTSNQEEIIPDGKLPLELNRFYSNIGETNNINYKAFSFTTYQNIKDQLLQDTLINIGRINQGMGYSVGLYYNSILRCYMFITEGGGDYVSRSNNLMLLENIREILDTSHPLYDNYFDGGTKLMTGLNSVLNFISQYATNYEDDTSFLNSSKTISL